MDPHSSLHLFAVKWQCRLLFRLADRGSLRQSRLIRALRHGVFRILESAVVVG